MLTHNDLKKGTRIRAVGMFGQGPREGELMDGKKGTIRMVRIDETNGHFAEMGSIYVDEIKEAEIDGEWQPVELSESHEKKMASIRNMLPY